MNIGNNRSLCQGTYDEDVLLAGGKGVAGRVLHGDDVEGSRVGLHVQNGAHAARDAPLGDHRQLANLELQDVKHLARSDVHLENRKGE